MGRRHTSLVSPAASGASRLSTVMVGLMPEEFERYVTPGDSVAVRTTPVAEAAP